MSQTQPAASQWRHLFRVPFFAIALCPGFAAAQSTTSSFSQPGLREVDKSAPQLSITWSQVRQALERQPRLIASRYRVDGAHSGVAIEQALPNPLLAGSVDRGMPRNGGNAAFEWELAIELPLGWLTQRQARIRTAQASVALAAAEGTETRRELSLQLQTLFWSLVYDQARAATLEKLENQTAALAHAVKLRVDKGEARPVEAVRVGIELERVASDRERAERALASSHDELLRWLNPPTGSRLVAVADLDVLPTVPTLATALATTFATHPRLMAAEARVRQREAEVDTEKLARLPSLDVAAFAASELDRRAFGANATLELPLWNWNAGRIAQAEAFQAAERADAEAARFDLETLIRTTHTACSIAVATAQRFQSHLVPSAEAASATMERTYQLGEASLLEAIDARRALLDARRQLLAALYDAHLECGRLDTLMGVEHP